jgi:predicted RNA-binding Zn-ribbon protein involved in translation (DUF1610 family)
VSEYPVLRAREEMERTYELLRHSNERIRLSLELLDHVVPGLVRRQAPPVCKSCDIGMTWSRSTLDETRRAVVHIFFCPSCGEQARTETRAKLFLKTGVSEPEASGEDLVS